MRTTSTRRLVTLLTSLGALISAPAAAQLSTTANGPYVATPSWSQKLTTNRFVILANWNHEAVLDRESGLVWERSPDLFGSRWPDAHRRCNSLSVGGRMGWRLPSVHELASLLDPTILLPAPTSLPAGHPFHQEPPVAWSATTSADDTDIVWRVRFFDRVVGPVSKNSVIPTWCVRGATVAEAQ